eukprot:3317468-Alexandrium_andersonii.AAC.1
MRWPARTCAGTPPGRAFPVALQAGFEALLLSRTSCCSGGCCSRALSGRYSVRSVRSPSRRFRR